MYLLHHLLIRHLELLLEKWGLKIADKGIDLMDRIKLRILWLLTSKRAYWMHLLIIGLRMKILIMVNGVILERLKLLIRGRGVFHKLLLGIDIIKRDCGGWSKNTRISDNLSR